MIDTKYKAPKGVLASSGDIAQVIAYAVAKDCREAVLLYPGHITEPLDTVVNGIRVRTLTFSLEQSPDIAGNHFLNQLNLPAISQAQSIQALSFAIYPMQMELSQLVSVP